MSRGGEGWFLKDLWAKRGAQTGKRWQAWAYDPATEKYGTKSFADGEEAKAKGWARRQRNRYGAGVDTREVCDLLLVGREYAQELQDRGRAAPYVAEVRRIVQAVYDAGAEDMRSPRFIAALREWFAGLTVHARFANRAEAGAKLSPHTVNRYLTILRAVSKHAITAGYLDRDPLPAIKRFSAPKVAKPSFPIADIRRMLDPSRANDRYWLTINLLLYTGCRLGEALHLRWESIDWTGKRVHIRLPEEGEAYELKRSKERRTPLQPELADLLAPLVKENGYVIPDDTLRTPNSKRRWQDFRAYLIRCGIDAGAYHPHCTRHTWAGLMVATGADLFSVKAWAGHESLATTEGYSQSVDQYREVVAGWPPGELRLRPPTSP